MPSYPCRHPTCAAYVQCRGEACQEHADTPGAQADRHRRYDLERRDRAAKAFYNSAGWIRARANKLAADPVCERCGGEWARHVHHHKPIDTHPELRLVQRNLRALCPGCHSAVEAEQANDAGSE
jgi:5-methylcytosine-specific restriction endonuclease McrA